MFRKPIFLLLLISLLTANCNQAQTNTDMASNKVNAPEISTQYGWLNTDKPYKIADFRGKFVLLDFWTYGCINCQHIIPDLKKLENEYEKELVVIGIHSAKFDNEKNTDNIRKAILKFGIEHPVVNDADYKVWTDYAVDAWPTVVLIDPNGKIVLHQSGEGIYPVVKPLMEKLVPEFGDKINRQVFAFRKETMEAAVLRFPAKMIKDNVGDFYITDAGNNRIVKINKEGKILLTIGSGQKGLLDGDFTSAQFNDPQGLAITGNTLYVADTRNHAIRKIDLTNKTVTTFLGTGQQSKSYKTMDVRKGDALNSPWDLLIVGNQMYIAMAGNHQIWRADLTTGNALRYAGNGYEKLADGKLLGASFSQPSGFAIKGGKLYIADTEASAIREIDTQKGTVKTIFGRGLFDFGDLDGDVETALIQHSVGIAVKGDLVYIADTYNGKVKVYNMTTKILSTLVAGLEEPNNVLIDGDELWITNTNKNQIIVVNLKTKEKRIVAVG